MTPTPMDDVAEWIRRMREAVPTAGRTATLRLSPNTLASLRSSGVDVDAEVEAAAQRFGFAHGRVETYDAV